MVSVLVRRKSVLQAADRPCCHNPLLRRKEGLERGLGVAVYRGLPVRPGTGPLSPGAVQNPVEIPGDGRSSLMRTRRFLGFAHLLGTRPNYVACVQFFRNRHGMVIEAGQGCVGLCTSSR